MTRAIRTLAATAPMTLVTVAGEFDRHVTAFFAAALEVK